jgi:hypothetical protein
MLLPVLKESLFPVDMLDDPLENLLPSRVAFEPDVVPVTSEVGAQDLEFSSEERNNGRYE